MNSEIDNQASNVLPLNAPTSPKNARSSRRTVIIRALMTLAAIGGFVSMIYGLKTWLGIDFSDARAAEELRIKLLAFGALTPLVFCLFYMCRGVIYVPEPFLMVTAGFLVGPLWGIALVVVGCLLASATAYGMAKFLMHSGAKSFLQRILPWKPAKKLRPNRRMLLRVLFLWRLLPFFPFTMMTYGSAIVGIPFGRFLLAMGVGVISPAALYCFLGDFILNINVYSRSWQFYAGMAIFLGLIIALSVYVIKRYLRGSIQPLFLEDDSTDADNSKPVPVQNPSAFQ